MSVQAMSWVIDHSKHKGSELLCLIMIANYAHADGSGAYPSASRLAKDCRMSSRQVVRIIHRLEASGALRIDPEAGPRGTHLMTVVMDSDAPKIVGADSLTPDKLSYPKRSKRTPKPVVTTDILSDVDVIDVAMSPDKMSDDKTSGGDKITAPPDKMACTYTDIAMSPKPLVNRQLEPSFNVPNGTGDDSPFGLCMVLCDVNGVEWKSLGEKTRGQQLGIAKQMAADGFTGERLRRLLVYLKSESWRTGLIDLKTAVAAAPGWELNGEPERERLPTKTTRGGARNGELNGNDWIRQIAPEGQDESTGRGEARGSDRRHIPELSAG